MSVSHRKHVSTARRLVATLFLVVGLTASAWLVAGGKLSAVTTRALPDRTGLETQLIRGTPATTRAIESIRVGDRVFARNPEVDNQTRSRWDEPDWQECLLVSLRMPIPNTKEAGEYDLLKIELLRPEDWFLERTQLLVDGAAERDEESLGLIGVTIDLSLPEMGANGRAVVERMRPVPAISSGPGQVVTATFAHPPSTTVLDVTFEDSTAPIGVTSNHLFWSASDEAFLPIEQFEVGDRVLTIFGETKRIESMLARPGPGMVFNLEVYGEHVYFVGDQGVLSHNMYGDRGGKRFRHPNVRPGGHQAGDISTHGRLSPGKNRASGHTNTADDLFVQSHHGIQDEWAKQFAREHNLPYKSSQAPTILLRSSSGESHALISAAQRARRAQSGFGNDIVSEFNIGYRELIDAGVSVKDARRLMKQAYKYFDSIGAFK